MLKPTHRSTHLTLKKLKIELIEKIVSFPTAISQSMSVYKGVYMPLKRLSKRISNTIFGVLSKRRISGYNLPAFPECKSIYTRTISRQLLVYEYIYICLNVIGLFENTDIFFRLPVCFL